jgi:hypothetical protein
VEIIYFKGILLPSSADMSAGSFILLSNTQPVTWSVFKSDEPDSELADYKIGLSCDRHGLKCDSFR